MTSAVAETQVIGDVTGQYTGDPGFVEWTAYLTDDVTAPSTTSLLTLNGRDFLTFKHIDFVGANQVNGDCINGSTAISTNLTFEDCTFSATHVGSSGTVMVVSNSGSTALNWTVRRCIINHLQRGIGVSLAANAVSDYDANVLIENCAFYGAGRDSAVRVGLAGSTNTFGGGGVDVRYCTFWYCGGGAMNVADSTNADGANACTFEHCVGVGVGGGALSASASGQLTEDYNFWYCSVAHTNVTNGSNNLQSPTAVVKRRPFHFGQALLHGVGIRPFMEPLAGATVLNAHTAASSPPTVDLWNRPRPAGGLGTSLAVGCFERHDTAIRGTVIAADSGSNIEITGPGDHDFELPVDTTATTISIKVRTSGYSGSNYPTMSILNGGEAGVADATATATVASASGYEVLTIGPFTPTSVGIVTVRLRSRTNNGSGVTAWDTVQVT